jgi:hypothetical protein
MADHHQQAGSADESSKAFLGHGTPSIDDIPSLPTPSHFDYNNNNNYNKNNSTGSNASNTDNITQELNISPQNDPVVETPQFKSALSYTEVRDYAYPEFHPLHYGVPLETEEFDNEDYEEDDDEVGTYPDSYMRDGGPPWKEDSDLASPVVISHSVGDRISKEYEFSVASADEIHGRAVALFDFIPENENEAPLKEGQVIWVSYRHGQGWLVAEDPRTGETGLVPEEYVQMITGHEYLSSQTEDLNGHYIEDEDDEQLQQEQLQDDDELHQQSQQQQSGIHYTEQATSSSRCKSAAVRDADGDSTRQQLVTHSDQFSQSPSDALPLKEDPELEILTTSFETTKWS